MPPCGLVSGEHGNWAHRPVIVLTRNNDLTQKAAEIRAEV